MSDSVLDFFAHQHASFLHGHGLTASLQLLAQTELQGQEKVLEIGCGTGASLIFLKSRYPNLHLSGGDISPLMCQKARKRVAFTGLRREIDIHQLPTNTPLPFPDESFELIWIESVLAILDTPTLKGLLADIHRMLKPGGRLASNESLWLSTVSSTEIKHINQQCLTHFGIIQANGDIPNALQWEKLLADSGFSLPFQATCKSLPLPSPPRFSRPLFRSKLYTRLGQLKGMLSLSQRRYTQRLLQLEKEIMGSGEQKLAAHLFIAQKR